MSATGGFNFQERDTSTPKNATTFITLSEKAEVSMAGCFPSRLRSEAHFQERETSSPKNATTFFISGEISEGYDGADHGKADIFGNAKSNQHKRGAL